jgi:hypothetical protein
MVDCFLTIKNHIHELTAKLWSNNEQGIFQFLIMQLMSTLEP